MSEEYIDERNRKTITDDEWQMIKIETHKIFADDKDVVEPWWKGLCDEESEAEQHEN